MEFLVNQTRCSFHSTQVPGNYLYEAPPRDSCFPVAENHPLKKPSAYILSYTYDPVKNPASIPSIPPETFDFLTITHPINTIITMAGVEVAIVIYSTYGHIVKLAEAEKRGIEAAGGRATIFQ